MSEGEHTPENKQLTPSEATKRFIENSTYRINSFGVRAFASGVMTTLAMNHLVHGEVGHALTAGFAAGILACYTARDRSILKKEFSSLRKEDKDLNRE